MLGLTMDSDGNELRFLERLQRRDKQAWGQLFETHRDQVFGQCLRMLRNRQDAEDISQEVFLRAVRSIGAFRGDASLRTWLHQITHNACLTHLASVGKRLQDSLDPSVMTEFASESPSPEEASASAGMRAILENALGELDPVFREAILLREVEGLSYEEIAQVTGVSVNTVKTRIYRARMKLQQRLVGFR